ncbi:MAG: hypothetical protein AAGA29_05800 [Planctomycetota bacterium]
MAKTTPRYTVGEAQSDGMSATLWLGHKQTHTIWCSTADAANEAASILADYFNVTAEMEAEEARINEIGGVAFMKEVTGD